MKTQSARIRIRGGFFNFDPMTNPDLHLKDCGLGGVCSCDADKLSFFGKLQRLLSNR